MKYYIFRIDYTNLSYFKERLEKGILRQGWGVKGLSLVDEKGNKRNKKEWVDSCPENWRKTENERKYLERKFDNLNKMREMKKGDIIVIPKFPEWDMLSIYRVKGEYYFDLEEGQEDYGHCIPVEPATIDDNEKDKCFKYNSNNESKEIHSKLRGYQTSINSVNDNGVKEAINELLKKISDIGEYSVIDLLKNTFEKTIDEKNKEGKIFSIRNNEVEEVVEEIFKKQGYILDDKNFYDKKGGDVDRLFIKYLPILEEVNNEITSCRIYVQIKKKEGICDEEEGIDQLEKIVDTDIKEEIKIINGEKIYPNGIYKVLVCTGKFSQRIEEIARDRGIILIDGSQLIRLCLKNL